MMNMKYEKMRICRGVEVSFTFELWRKKMEEREERESKKIEKRGRGRERIS